MRRLSAAQSTDKYIYALLTLYPLFVGFKGYSQTTVSKFVLFAALTLLWLIISGLSLFRKQSRPGRAEPMVSAAVGAYVFCCLLSALCSPFGASVLLGEGRFDGLVTTLLCAIVFFGTAFFAKPRAGYLFAVTGAGAVSCLIGVLQLLGLNPLGLFPADYDYYDAGVEFTGSFFGTMGNADLQSAYISLLLPAAAAYYILSEKRRPLLLPALAVLGFSLKACGVSAGLLACGLTALVAAPLLINCGKRLRRALECAAVLALSLALALCFNGGRSGEAVRVWLSLSPSAAAMLIAALLAISARFALRKSEFSAAGLRIFFVFLSAAAFFGALAAVYFLPPESGTLREISQLLHGHIEDGFGSSRILIWREVLSLIPARPLLGGGPGTLALRLDIEFSRLVPETGKTLTAYIDNAHNVYLGAAASTGLPSLLCYLTAQIASVVLALKKRSTAALCLVCALGCYWLQDFFGLGMFLVSPLMWVCWGLLASELCKPISKDAE